MFLLSKPIIITIGYMLCFGLTLTLLITFTVAYVNPEKAVLVTINDYGEAHVEWFMNWIIFDIILIGLYYSFKNIKRSKKCRKNTK